MKVDINCLDFEIRPECWRCSSIRYFVDVNCLPPDKHDSNEAIAQRLRAVSKALASNFRNVECKKGCSPRSPISMAKIYRDIDIPNKCSTWTPMFPHHPTMYIDREHPELNYIQFYKKGGIVGYKLTGTVLDDPLASHNSHEPFKACWTRAEIKDRSVLMGDITQ